MVSISQHVPLLKDSHYTCNTIYVQLLYKCCLKGKMILKCDTRSDTVYTANLPVAASNGLCASGPLDFIVLSVLSVSAWREEEYETNRLMIL